MPFEDLPDLLRGRGHLVHEIATVEVEAFGAEETGAGMPLHHRHARFEPVGQHRPPAGFDQRDGGDLVPGQQRALTGTAEDHPVVAEFEAWSHRTAHRKKADDGRHHRAPADAPATEQEDDATQLGHAGKWQEERPRHAGVDDGAHATMLTPPGTICARNTLPRWTSPSTSCHCTSGAMISTDRAFRCSMLSPSARCRTMRQSTPARTRAVRGPYKQTSNHPSSMAIFGPKRNGAAPSIPALTTSTTTAVSRVSSLSVRMTHSNSGARGSHQAPARK